MFDLIMKHGQDILAILGGLVAVATIIVKLTPTPKDDAVLGWVVKVLDLFSVQNPKGTVVLTKEQYEAEMRAAEATGAADATRVK